MSIAPAPTAPPATPTAPATTPVLAPPRVWSPLPALLSYFVPGLGQISQGRVGKGVLFFVCIYALFFYGTVLGSGSTKVSETSDSSGKVIAREYRITSPVYLPAIATEKTNNPLGLPLVLADLYNRPQFIAQFWAGIASWPAIWQYKNDNKDTVFGSYQSAPDAVTNNAVNTAIGRPLDLGWVLTVIAGVLNILVIYDALAGPAFLTLPTPETKAT